MSRYSSSGCSGCAGCGTTWMVLGVVHLLFGGLAAQYVLTVWLPILHKQFPETINAPGPVPLWPLCILLGLVGGVEFFIPAAIVTWILLGLHIIG